MPGRGFVRRHSVWPSWQCADDPDAVCTRSVTVRLPGLHNSLVKLKHGGGVSMDGQDVQIPLLQGMFCPPPPGLGLAPPTPQHLHSSAMLTAHLFCEESYLWRGGYPQHASLQERKASWRRRGRRPGGSCLETRELLQARERA